MNTPKVEITEELKRRLDASDATGSAERGGLTGNRRRPRLCREAQGGTPISEAAKRAAFAEIDEAHNGKLANQWGSHVQSAIDTATADLRAKLDAAERRGQELERHIDKVGFYFAGTEHQRIADQALAILKGDAETEGWLRQQRASLTEAREQIAEIISELRNYELNGSNAAKQIRGIYSDGDACTAKLREARTQLAASEATVRELLAKADEWESAASWMGIPMRKGPRNITDCAADVRKILARSKTPGALDEPPAAP